MVGPYVSSKHVFDMTPDHPWLPEGGDRGVL